MTRTAWLTASLGFGYLVLGWAAVVSVDFLNVRDAQSWLTADFHPLPLLWYELFSEASPAENLQWAALATAFLAMATVAWRLRQADSRPAYPLCAVLAIGLLLMLVEDSLNLRHIVVDHYFPTLFGDDDTYPRSLYRLIWELMFYSLLAALMALPFLAFWRSRAWEGTGLKLLVFAYAIYGFAGFSSAMRRIGDWQERLGQHIIARFKLSELPAWTEALERMERAREQSENYTHTLGYLLTDHLIEESIELIATTLLVTGLLCVRRNMLQKCGDLGHPHISYLADRPLQRRPFS